MYQHQPHTIQNMAYKKMKNQSLSFKTRHKTEISTLITIIQQVLKVLFITIWQEKKELGWEENVRETNWQLGKKKFITIYRYNDAQKNLKI